MADAQGSDATHKHGYTYWKRDIDDAHVLPDNKPQKLEATAQVETSSTGSRWNAAGTWEEKNVSAAAREELERILSEEWLLLEGENTRVCSCKAVVTGESQAFNIRGRSRLGFEFQVKVSWKGSFEGEDVSGDFEIPELDSSDIDGVEIRDKSGSKASEASKRCAAALKKGARPAVKKACEELSKRILER
mmetsp:Transcript_59021/g.172786  ORF Transcript_59021/g.172786 Transcript_59021/m.172786 type:complete len:190 (+) Transcript_59021:63-632(+)